MANQQIHIAQFAEQSSTPATPGAGNRKLYPRDDGWYEVDSAGNDIRASANIGVGATKTISSGVVAVGVDRNIVVAAESGTTDTLDEVTGLSVGERVYLRADTGDTITVTHNSGSATVKIHLIGDRDKVLDEQNAIELILVASNVLVQSTAVVAPAMETIIAPTTLGSAQANVQLGTVTSDPLPTDYEALMLILTVRSDRVSTSDLLLLRFNNDTGSNYKGMFTHIDQAGTVTSQNDTGGVTVAKPIPVIPASSSPSNYFAIAKVLITGYSRSVYTHVVTQGFDQHSTSLARLQFAGYVWEDTSTVEEIDILCNVGNLDTGTTYALYGIK